MNPDPKIKNYQNAAYLKFIRSKPCVVCRRKSEPHHIRRQYWGAGTGIKPHDYVTIPLCRNCHTPETEVGLNVERLIIQYLMEYIENGRKKIKRKRR